MGEAINLVEKFKVEKVIFNCDEFNELEKELIKILDKKKILYYSCIKELNIDEKKYIFNNETNDNENDNFAGKEFINEISPKYSIISVARTITIAIRTY